jgi:Protein of unknown function (DUF1524)
MSNSQTETQPCKDCEIEKPLSEFHFRKDSGRHRSSCKACWSDKTKAWAKANPSKRKDILARSETKNKAKYTEGRSAWKKRNRAKINEQQRAWREANPERNKAYGRAAYARSPERGRRYTRDWYNKNREYALQWASVYHKRRDVRDRVNAYKKTRRATEPAVAINDRMRGRLRGSLSTVDPKAGRAWKDLVGYSVDDLRRHLEAQFTKGMSWSNVSKWEIDHIVPLADFDIKEAGDREFMAAWSLGNLRPLWRPLNRSKSDKRVFLL